MYDRRPGPRFDEIEQVNLTSPSLPLSVKECLYVVRKSTFLHPSLMSAGQYVKVIFSEMCKIKTIIMPSLHGFFKQYVCGKASLRRRLTRKQLVHWSCHLKQSIFNLNLNSALSEVSINMERKWSDNSDTWAIYQ